MGLALGGGERGRMTYHVLSLPSLLSFQRVLVMTVVMGFDALTAAVAQNIAHQYKLD